MAVKWTKEQQMVIDTRNKDILVSAAAGSGKTAVLVARILKMITDEAKPVDIDRLLVVTFTNAAAAEMKERIRDALEERAQQEPDNVHLQRQLVLVHNAKITTIHSFCLHVLRNHFQAVGIDPAFRIADEGEILLLEQEAVRETVNEAYETRDSEFSEFLEQVATGKGDTEVEEMILQIYHFALGQPFPEEWLRQCRETSMDMDVSHGEDQSEKKNWHPAWLDFIESDTALRLSDIREQLVMALRLSQDPDGPYPYEKALLSDLEMLDRLQGGSSYQEYLEAFRNMGTFARAGTKKDERISDEKKEQVQAVRADCKEQLLDLRDQYYYDDFEALRENYIKSGATVRVLTKLTEAFMKRLSEKKADKNILDFGDMEHLALNALVTRTSGGKPPCTGSEAESVCDTKNARRCADGGAVCPTAVALEYAETFEEVMIDEYQDSNLVQELILSSVSGKGCGAHNRFMVGDVKQSIYRFRLARPELFMEKYHRYARMEPEAEEMDGGESAPGVECRIDLHRNFRSRPQVLDTVNYIFRQIMTEPLGGVAYDDDAALYPGAVFPSQGDCCTAELLLLDGSAESSASEGGASSVNVRKEEARVVGRRIRELVGTMPVVDKESGEHRPARYGDIVILLRTVSGWAETFGEVLADMGIPCFTGSQKGYFSTAEVRVVLSYLQILDNPLQDIPFAAVLRSAIGRFTDEELARIRIAAEVLPSGASAEGGASEAENNGNICFYECCRLWLEHSPDTKIGNKLKTFFKTYERLRADCDHMPVHMLLWELLDETGYGEYAAALPAGRQRRANLDMLVEKAIAYEATSYRGLYHFVRYIENLKKYEVDYGEANLGSEADDTVRIMSIHKSKGLEFPIVFVSGMGKQFNESDVRSRVVMHPEWGIACDYVWRPSDTGALSDEPPRMRQPSLLKKMIQQKLSAENLGEELRVLYVAVTRAKEKLIMTGGVKNLEKKKLTWKMAAKSGNTEIPSRGSSAAGLGYSWLSGASSYLDWVVPSLLRDPEGRTLVLTRVYSSIENAQEEKRIRTDDLITLEELLYLDPSVCRDEQAKEYLERVFSSAYPYEANQAIPGKVTVSELKKMSQKMEEPDALEMYASEPVVPLIPRFERPSNAKRSSNDGRDLSSPDGILALRAGYPPSESEVALPERERRTVDNRPAGDGTACVPDSQGESGQGTRPAKPGGAARGTVYHTFMENLDFSKKEELRFQLEELISCGKMTPEEAAVICLDEISAFLETQTGRKMCHAAREGRLFREQPFVLGVPAEELLQNHFEKTDGARFNGQETVLVQGIIDAYFLEDDQITILDYKTDRVEDGDILIKRYQTQMDYYAEALERLTGKKIRDRIIYSFCLGKEIYLL